MELSEILIQNYLPSFYYNELQNINNGQNDLAPLFNTFNEILSNALFDSVQLLNTNLSLERSNKYTYKYLKLIKFNIYKQIANFIQIELDEGILEIEQLSKDANFSTTISKDSYSLLYVDGKHILEINKNEFSNNKILPTYLYAKNITLKYSTTLYKYNLFNETKWEVFNDDKELYDINYRFSLALHFALRSGSSIKHIEQAIAILEGYLYSRHSGKIVKIEGSTLFLQDENKVIHKYTKGEHETFCVNINDYVNKYDLLETHSTKLTSFIDDPNTWVNDPNLEKYYKYLLIHTTKEPDVEYANLNFDTALEFDGTDLVFDMGTNTHTETYPTFLQEAFRNIFIVTIDSTKTNQNLTPFINKLLKLSKPIYVDYILNITSGEIEKPPTALPASIPGIAGANFIIMPS